MFEFTEEKANLLQAYLEENFSLSFEAKRLVRNILDYVSLRNYASNDDITEDILLLLDGIGITKEEILEIIKQH